LFLHKNKPQWILIGARCEMQINVWRPMCFKSGKGIRRLRYRRAPGQG